jgi:hypothetical protein
MAIAPQTDDWGSNGRITIRPYRRKNAMTKLTIFDNVKKRTMFLSFYF